ncbi:MAG: hypothetical protein R6X02_02480 [Enhygromyxa sp.]
MTLRVSTPASELELGPLCSLRFATVDGWRGIRPGHEPARASVRKGPIRCAASETEVRWLATEGGLLLIDRHELRILTRWAEAADTLAQLRALVEARDAERARLEDEARALGHRHEVATRRALMALERKVTRP